MRSRIPLPAEQPLNFFNAPQSLSKVNNGMAVRTDRPQVLNGVDLVRSADRSNRHQMMYMDESRSDRTVGRCEVESTNGACCSVVRNACCPCGGTPFIGVDRHLSDRAFVKIRVWGQFLRKWNLYWTLFARRCVSAACGLRRLNRACPPNLEQA